MKNYTVVDLEMTHTQKKSEARKKCTTETIQIGAIMLNDKLQEISSFRTYVRPEYNDRIVGKIEVLTGITTEMVKNAPTFNEAIRMFTNWCLGLGDEIIIYAWSESDYDQISREMRLKEYRMTEDEIGILGNRWSDFQEEFDSHLGFKRKLSLKTALNMAGIDFKGREHDALDDARNTAQLLQIFRDRDLFDCTLRKIKNIMHPTNIGNTLGSMFDFSKLACA